MIRSTTRTALTVLLSIAGVLAIPSAAFAYAGPGGVVTGIGALLALVAAVLAAFFGFLWYPIKRAAHWLHGLRHQEARHGLDPESADGR